LEKVNIVPRASSAGMLSQLEQRNYWCISRQRVWGVPLPVFYEVNSRRPLISRLLDFCSVFFNIFIYYKSRNEGKISVLLNINTLVSL